MGRPRTSPTAAATTANAHSAKMSKKHSLFPGSYCTVKTKEGAEFAAKLGELKMARPIPILP